MVLGEDTACAILQQSRLELFVPLPGQGQDRHFTGGDQSLHCFPVGGIGQIEIGKDQIHSMLAKQRQRLCDAFGVNELNRCIAEFGERFPKQENIQRVVFHQQKADGFLIVHRGGKVTFLNQNVSIVRAICEQNPKKTRKEIIALCMNCGVNKNTAATQFSLWKSAKNKADASEGEGDNE